MSLKYEVKSALSPYPALFVPLYRALAGKTNRQLLVGPETELVIEGFPRSANTFAVIAFQHAQLGRVHVAHHLHAEAQLLYAVRRGIPALALIREPEAAIRSLKLAYPKTDENVALGRWLTFYSAVDKVHDRVVVSDFAETTGNLGAVIDRLNARFGTNFARFETTDATVTAVYDHIGRINRSRKNVPEMLIARPLEKKREAGGKVALRFDPTRLAGARALHRRLVESDSPSLAAIANDGARQAPARGTGQGCG